MTNKQKVALITGACGGIGSLVAKDLAEKGYRLILVDINQAANQALAESLNNAIAINLDLTDRAALRTFCHQLRYFKLDLAFINAGIVFTGDVVDIEESQIDMQLDLNLRSAIMLNQACAQNMVEHGTGHIINTVSMGALTPLKGSATYSASKFGLRGFLSSLYSELKPHGVKVSGIYPSGVDTAMLRYEATHNGSLLNFLSTPQTPEDVLRGFNIALRKAKLEVYVPFSDSVSAKLIGLFPSLFDKLYPWLEPLGRRGHKKYLAKIAKQKDQK